MPGFNSKFIDDAADGLVEITLQGARRIAGVEVTTEPVNELSAACKHAVMSVLNRMIFVGSKPFLSTPVPCIAIGGNDYAEHVFVDDELDGNVEIVIWETLLGVSNEIANVLNVPREEVEQEMHSNSAFLSEVRSLKTFLNGFAYSASMELSKADFVECKDTLASFFEDRPDLLDCDSDYYFQEVLKFLRTRNVFVDGVLFNSFFKNFLYSNLEQVCAIRSRPAIVASRLAGAIVWMNKNYAFMYEKYNANVGSINTHMTVGDCDDSSPGNLSQSLTLIKRPDPIFTA